MSVSLDITITVSDTDAVRVITAYRDAFPLGVDEEPPPGDTDRAFFIRNTKYMIKQVVRKYETKLAVDAISITDVEV